VTVAEAMNIGTDPAGSGGVTGTLDITNALTQVSVGGNFTINEMGKFAAAPGVTSRILLGTMFFYVSGGDIGGEK
jgi:hypothetical protein